MTNKRHLNGMNYLTKILESGAKLLKVSVHLLCYGNLFVIDNKQIHTNNAKINNTHNKYYINTYNKIFKIQLHATFQKFIQIILLLCTCRSPKAPATVPPWSPQPRYSPVDH